MAKSSYSVNSDTLRLAIRLHFLTVASTSLLVAKVSGYDSPQL